MDSDRGPACYRESEQERRGLAAKQMDNIDVLALIASRLSDEELKLLFEAGLWPIMRLFAGTQHFAYLRCRHKLGASLTWRHDWDWKRVRYGLLTHEFRKHETPNLDYTPTVELLIASGVRFDKAVVRNLISSVRGNAVALGLILDNLEDKEQITSVGSVFIDAARYGHLAVMQLLSDRYPERVRPDKLTEALSRAASGVTQRSSPSSCPSQNSSLISGLSRAVVAMDTSKSLGCYWLISALYSMTISRTHSYQLHTMDTSR